MDMLRSNNKSLGNHVVSPEEEKERLQWEGFAEKEGFKSGQLPRPGAVGEGHKTASPKYLMTKRTQYEIKNGSERRSL